jgi:hypothetical protein
MAIQTCPSTVLTIFAYLAASDFLFVNVTLGKVKTFEFHFVVHAS